MALVLWCSSKSTPRIEKQNHILLSCLSTNLLQYHRRDGQRRCQPGQPGAGSRRRGGRGRRIPLAPTRSDLGRAGAKSRARCHRRTRELRRRGPGGGGWEAGVEKAPQQRDRDMDWAGEGEGAMAAGPYLLLLPSLCGEKFGACGAHLKYGLLHPS